MALRRRCARAFWALVPKGVVRLYYGSSSHSSSSSSSWPWSSSSSIQTSNKRNNNSEASSGGGSNMRFGPSANSNSSSTDRNVTGTGEERPCDPVPARAPSTPYEDKRPPAIDDDSRDGVASAPVIRKRRPEPGETGERSAETGSGSEDNNNNNNHLHYRRDDDDEEEQEETTPCDVGVEDEEEGEEERVLSEIESGILDVFSDAYCNKHLMYGVLELILVRLMPELAQKGVIDLRAERLD